MRAKNESAASAGTLDGAGNSQAYGALQNTLKPNLDQHIHRVSVKPDIVALVSPSDAALVREYDWRRGGTDGSYAVALIRDGSSVQTVYLHRLILGAGLGDIVDHQDGDRLNCTRENLRLVTPTENAANIQETKNQTGFRNVAYSPKRKRYQARVQKQGGTFRAPYRKTAEEAAHDADLLLRAVYPGITRLNFPSADELPILRRAPAGGDQ